MSKRTVTHWFYFPSKAKMDEAIVALLNKGLNVESVRDVNEGLGEDVPFITDEDREKRMHEEMEAFESGKIDEYMNSRQEFREALNWQCVMMQDQEIEDELTAKEFYEFSELAQNFGGDYDGHEYGVSEEEAEDFAKKHGLDGLSSD